MIESVHALLPVVLNQFNDLLFFKLRMVGLSTGQSLDSVVHSSLAEHGQQAAKAVENFGIAVEHLLVKHGKKIVGREAFYKRM